MRRRWNILLTGAALFGCAAGVLTAAETASVTATAATTATRVAPIAPPVAGSPAGVAARTAAPPAPSHPSRPAPIAAKAAPAAAADSKPTPADTAQARDIPVASRILREGEMLIVAPGQNLTVESPASPERRLPVLDAAGRPAWVTLPARGRQVVAIHWLDTSNIKKLVEIEMLEGDLFIAADPRDQSDLALAVRGRKLGRVVEGPAGVWTAVDHRTLKVHFEVDASLRLVGYGQPLLPAGGDATRDLGLHIFASLRPGAPVQNAGATTLVLEQYATTPEGWLFGDRPTRVLLPPETALTTNGGRYDLKHFYVPEPGQPAGPRQVQHVPVDPGAVARDAAGTGPGSPRPADAPPGVLP